MLTKPSWENIPGLQLTGLEGRSFPGRPRKQDILGFSKKDSPTSTGTAGKFWCQVFFFFSFLKKYVFYLFLLG